MRTGRCNRKTSETAVDMVIVLDNAQHPQVKTGEGFLDHMLTLFGVHGLCSLTINASGDTHIDAHHLTEDVGIALGLAVREAIGDGKGILRYGSGLYPMDEALVQVAIDMGGRPYFSFSPNLPKGKVGQFDVELVEEFFRAFAFNARLNLHIRIVAGDNLHHLAEACFKGVAVTLAHAWQCDTRRLDQVPSSKGVL